MDLTMVDVTGLAVPNAAIGSIAGPPSSNVHQPDVQTVREGDEVVVFGDLHPVAELAQEIGTIPYEALTGISRRVKRIYYYE